MYQQIRINLRHLLKAVRSPDADGQKGSKMFHKHSQLVTGLLFAIALTVLWIAPAYAQQEAGQWMTVQDNEPHWYSFRVGTNGADEADNQVSIGLYARPAGSASFYVYGGGDWGMWDQPQEGDWLGVGYSRDNGSQTWSGKLVPGTYFVRMEPMGASETRLAVSGTGTHRFTSLDHSQDFDFIVDAQQPDFVVAPQAVAALPSENPTANPATFTVAQPQPLAVQEPETELVPGRWMNVLADKPMWFAFYVGKVEDSGTSRVSISLFTELSGGGDFQIFTAETADRWGDGEGWFGAGTANANNSYSWSGDLVPGAYYVHANTQGAGPRLLAISGEAVTY
jgi:hypothetical protein